MKCASFHLNLLAETEKLSSSPIRLRVMLPVLALLAAVGMAIWWGTLTTQSFIVRSQTASLREELASKKGAHDAIVDNMKLANEEAAQLQQLMFYRGGCVRWGETFATIAEMIPIRMQLVRLEIPEPPPQILRDPKNPKRPPLLGPTNDTEAVSVVMTGRAARDTTIVSFLESLEGAAFSNRLGRVAVKSVQQEPQPRKSGEARLLAFELECRAVDRRFAE